MKTNTTKRVLTLVVILTFILGLMSFGIICASADGGETLSFNLLNYFVGIPVENVALEKTFISDAVATPTVLGVYETVEDARNDTNASSGYLHIHQAYYLAVRLSAESGKTYDFSALTASSISVKLGEEALAVIEVTLGGDDARIIIELPELHYFEWNTDDDNEHWMECSCGEKTEAAAHEYSETYQSDEYGHWIECECGKRIDESSHSGSEYDCDDDYHWIPCDTCGYRIDESIHMEDGSGWHTEDETYHWQTCSCGYQMYKAEHGYSDWQYEGDEHYKYCMECNREINRDAHNYQTDYDDNQHYTRCTVCECDKPDTYPEFHTLSWVTDGENHWKECADCEYESAHVKHNFQYYYDVYGIGDTHWTECECGEKTEEEAHDFGDYITDGYAHHRECACGKTADEGSCSGSGEFQSNGDEHWRLCDECSAKIEIGTHMEDGSAHHDESNHWSVCATCYAEYNVEAHSFSEWLNDTSSDEHYKECVVCWYEIGRAAHEYVPAYDKNSHWQECSCGEIQNDEIHEDLDANGKCDVCLFGDYDITATDAVVTVGGVEVTKVEEGTTVTIVAIEKVGYVFDGWVIAGATVVDANAQTTTFVMPHGDVTVEATYKKLYSVTVQLGTATPDSAIAGTTVTIVADAPAANMVFDKWIVISGSVTLADENNSTTTFTMPEGDVEVKATYKLKGYAVTLPDVSAYALIYPVGSSSSPVEEGGSFSFTIEAYLGLVISDVVVKANGVVLTPVDGVYTIQNVTAEQTVTVDATYEECIIVGGVAMVDGTYLANGASVTVTEKPVGGYAYYKSGVLTLNNYEYTGTGFEYDGTGSYAIIFSSYPIEIVFEGENQLSSVTAGEAIVAYAEVILSGTGSVSYQGNGFFQSAHPLTINGGSYNLTTIYSAIVVENTITINSGTFTIDAGVAGFYADLKITIFGGTFNITADEYGIFTFLNDITINNGKFNISAVEYAINSDSGSIIINAGTFDLKSTATVDEEYYCAIVPAPILNAGLTIQASTEPEGALGEYVEANFETYDRIVIKMPGHAVVLPAGAGITATGASSPVEGGGDYSFTIAFVTGYKAGEGFAVKANGVVLTPVDGVYTIEDITEDQTITVEGVEKISYNITTTYATATISDAPVSSATITDTVVITAQVRNGYRFVGWKVTGATVSDASASTTTIVANGSGDITVTANYELVAYDITITFGTAKVDDVTVTQATIKDVITIAAQERVGMVFSSWNVSGGTVAQTSSATTTFIADGTGPITIEATYIYARIPIVITNGTAKIGEDVVDRATIIETVTIIAAEKAGMTFNAWVVSGATVADASASTTTFVADGSGDIRIEATYVYTLYNVNVTSGVAKVDSATVTQATIQNKVTLVANTVAGKVFKEWQVTGGSVVLEDAEAATTTFQMTAGDVTIVALYEDAVYTIGATAATVTKESVAVTEAKMGDVLTITAIVPAGTTFKEWVVVGGTVASATDATTTFTVDGTGNITIRATFNSIPYSVTITGDKGSIWVNGHKDETTAELGDAVRMYADDPASGYYFAGWKVIKGNVVLADATQQSIEFEMVAEEVELEPIYKAEEHLDEVHFTFETLAVGDKAIINLVSDEPEKYYFQDAEITMHRNVGGSLTLTPEDTILAGKRYYLLFTVKRASNAYILDASTKVFINGEQVDVSMYRASFQFTYPNTITVTNGKAYSDYSRTDEITEANRSTWVYLKADEAPEGKVFSHWIVKAGGVVISTETAAETTFQVGEEAVEIEAIYDIILDEVTFTIEAPQVGQVAPTVLVSGDPTKYTAIIVKFYSYDSGFPTMGPTDVFLAGTKYGMRFEVAVEEGYALGNNTVFTVNGESCGCYGAIRQREWTFQFPVVLTFTNGKAYTTSARTEEIDYNNFFSGTIYLSADPAPEGKVFLMWRITRDGSVTYDYTANTYENISSGLYATKSYTFEAIYATPLEKTDVKVPVPTPGTTPITSITSPSPNFNILIESWTYLDEHGVKQTMGAEDTYQIGVVYTCNYSLVPAEGYCLEVYNDVTINGKAIDFNSRTSGTATRHGFIAWYSMIPVELNVTGGKVMVGGVETDERSFLSGTVVTIVPDTSLYPEGKTLSYWVIDGGSYLIDYATNKVENFTITIKNTGTTNGEVVIRAIYSEPFGVGSASTDVAHPAVGEAIVYSNEDVAGSSYYSAELLGWYDGETLLEAGHVFEAGKIYTARIRITPYASYYFTETLEADDLNNSFSGVGIAANAILDRGENGEYLIYTVSIKAKIRQENISVNVTAPVAGMAPSTEVTPEAGTECPEKLDRWEVYDESTSRFVKMGEDELFVVGRRYRVNIGFTSTSTHFIDIKNTVAYINGIKASPYSSGTTVVEDEKVSTRGWYVEFTVEAGADLFDITVDGGAASVDEAPITQIGGGIEVTITANAPATGKAFKEWQIISGEGVVLASITDATTTFVMPACDVRIEAVYRNTPHNVTVEGGSADVTFVGSGETVTVTVGSIPSGKYFAGWESSTGTVIFADENAETTTFAMIDSDVTITAIFADKTVLEEINFTVTAPANGNNPSYVINSAEADKYTAVVDRWRYGSTDMTPEDVFAWGESYYFVFTMTLDEKYTFDSNTVININGKKTNNYGNGGLQRYLYLEAPVSITVENGYAVTTDDINGEHLAETTYGDGVYLYVGELAANQYFVEWEVVSGGITIYNNNTANGASFNIGRTPVVIRAIIHTHTYDSKYTADKNNHWFECTDPDCPSTSNSIKDKTAHVPGPAATYETAQICTVCGYEIAAKLQAKTVTVTSGKAQVGGVDIANGTPVLPGTVVTIIADAPAEGCYFNYWAVNTGGITFNDSKSATTTFVMGTNNVTVTAYYATYSIIGGGTLNPEFTVPITGLTVGNASVEDSGSSWTATVIGYYDGVTKLNPTDVFVQGRTYTVDVRLTPSLGYLFDADATFEVEHDIYGTEAIIQSVSDTEILCRFTFVAKTLITSLNVNFQPPVSGNAASFVVTVPDDAPYTVHPVVYWYDADDYRYEAGGAQKLVFEFFNYYAIEFYLIPKEGYIFVDGVEYDPETSKIPEGNVVYGDTSVSGEGMSMFVVYNCAPNPIGATVTVEGGTACVYDGEWIPITTGSPPIGTRIWLLANEPEEGKTFLYWEVVSGNATIDYPYYPGEVSFLLTENVVIRAVYTDDVAHNITVTGGTASAATAKFGEEVWLTAGEAPEGKYFYKWVVKSGGVYIYDSYEAETGFTMTGANVEVEAIFLAPIKDIVLNVNGEQPTIGGSGDYTISVESVNGSTDFTDVIDIWWQLGFTLDSTLETEPEWLGSTGVVFKEGYYVIFFETRSDHFFFDEELTLTLKFTDGTVIGMCMNRGETGAYFIALFDLSTPAHTHTEVTVPGKTATCTESGLTDGKKCSVCGETLLAQESIPALGHTYDNETDATCNTCGFTRDVACKHTTTASIPGKAATCTETGLTEGTKCSACNEVLVAQQTIPVIPHTEETVSGKPATCTESGLSDGKKCSVCGEITVAQKTIEALGHTEQTVVGKAATCTESGLTDGKKCSVCDTVLVAQETIAALGHTEAVLEAKNATCTETGLTAGKKCSVCGEITVAQKTIAALGHTEETVKGTPATCTEAGLTDGLKCSVCGVTIKAQEVILVLGHTEETIQGIAATCTESGLTEGKRCTVCGITTVAQKTIEALGHTEVTVLGKEAACTEAGLTEGKKCSVCDVIILAQSPIQALGHTYDDANDETCNRCDYVRDVACTHTETETIPGTPATCTATGLSDGVKCKACEEIITAQETIPALGHSEELLEAKDSTCTEAGLTAGKKCSVCGEILVAQNPVAALGHTEETVKGTDATCTESGLTDGKKCSVCGVVLVAQETIPALGHSLIKVDGKAATCTVDGYKAHYKCTVCEVLYADEAGTDEIFDLETWQTYEGYIEAAHTFGEWQEEIPATTESAGTKAHYHCSVCEKNFDEDGYEIADLSIPKLEETPDPEETTPAPEETTPAPEETTPAPEETTPAPEETTPTPEETTPDAQPEQPTEEEPKKGLSGGAIAGIVVGSVVVVGAGGFSIFWFVVQKKSATELVTVTKALCKQVGGKIKDVTFNLVEKIKKLFAKK